MKRAAIGRWGFLTLLWTLGCLSASAQDLVEARLARFPAPSPDGREIAFCHQGDLWIVPAEGGEARRVTAHPASDSNPVWSPNGRWLAFKSDRDGNEDVYVIPVQGGAVRRLTWFNGYERPTGWTPDGSAVLFQGYRQVRETGGMGTFLVPLEGGEPVAVVPTGAKGSVLSPDGRRMAYMRGNVYWWRRGYEGPARYRLWMFEVSRPIGSDRELQGLGAPASRARDRGAMANLSRSAPRWTEPMCTAGGLYRKAALREEGRHMNLTLLGSVIVPDADDPDPHGFLDTYLSGPPDWSRPEIEVGSNRYPQWFPDGDHVLYLSEYHGASNLKVLSIAGASRAWLTRYEDARIRAPKMSLNGRLVAFEFEDGIYTVEVPPELPPPGSSEWPIDPPEPRRLHIRIPIDVVRPQIERFRVTRDASEFAVSPDGEQIAFVFQGDIFAMKANEDEKSAYQLTFSPARDYQIDWAPDSKSLVFVSDRSGARDLYLIRSTDENERRLARTLHRETIRLTDDEAAQWTPRFSPDGEQIAFVEEQGTLCIMDADGSDPRTLVENWSDLFFSWSPDSRWLLYTRDDNDFNTDVFIVSADGKEGPHNISRHPDTDMRPHWSPDGRMIAFVSERVFLDQVDIWYVWLSLEDEQRSREDRLAELAGDTGGAADDEGEKDGDEEEEEEEDEFVIEIDFDDIHRRLHRLTTFPGSESQVLVAEDCSGFAFVSDADGERDLWWIKWDGTEPKRITEGGQKPRAIRLGPESKNIYFLKTGGQIASVPFDGGKIKTYPFEAELTIDRSAQRRFVFDEAWRWIDQEFYDDRFHGVDWAAMREKYAAWVDAASTREDFEDVVKLMLGELNASHLHFHSGPKDWEGPSVGAQTGQLGVLFETAYRGPGRRIAHVVPRSPADREESRLEEDEIIHSVNGVELTPETNLSRLLDSTVGRRILIEVEDASGERREVVIRPESPLRMGTLYWEEVLAARRRFVREQSDGRVAYISIESMDTESVDVFERDLYAEAHGKEALILDVRGNPGGWTTDLLLTSLMAADHAYTLPRGGGPGYPERRRLLYAWTKPVVVLCDEHSFSNAEIFASAVQTLKRGAIVGQQTHGGVISTGGTHVGDGTWLRLPFRGWISRLDGRQLEGTGCMPDVVVDNHPEELAKGVDKQLQRALLEAMARIQ